MPGSPKHRGKLAIKISNAADPLQLLHNLLPTVGQIQKNNNNYHAGHTLITLCGTDLPF